MTDDQLQSIQNDLMKSLDADEKMEQSIKEKSKEIAKTLVKLKKARAIIDNSPYSFSYCLMEKNGIKNPCILAINETKFKIANGKYIPAKIEAEYCDDFSEEENVSKMIESYIRHITGLIKPEELE